MSETKNYPVVDIELQNQESTNNTSFGYLSNQKNKQFDITLNNVGLTVGKGDNTKKIIHSLDVNFKRGKLIAIMGSSGSGKTTLLNILGQRMGGIVSGDVLVNGRPFEKKEFKQNMAYVMQDDLLLPFLTVKESLTYAAKLRLTKDLSLEQKMEIVEQIIKELNLTSCQNTFIGGEGQKGISGGQKKRVSIGHELLHNPSVILLDEPTSGLDSATSVNLINSLQGLARQGRTVISTIHQPSSDVFFLFDKILLMANGHQIYYGSTKKMVSYFANLGYPCPQDSNPADYVLNLITTGYTLQIGNKSIESAEITKDLVEKFKPKEMKIVNYDNSDQTSTKRNKVSQFYKFGVLLDRTVKQMVRNPFIMIAKFFQNILLAVIMGLIFLRLGNSQEEVLNKKGFLFFVVVTCFFPALLGELYTFPAERNMFVREKAGGWYGLLAYYFSKIISIIPVQIISPLCYTLIVYWMVGLQSEAGKFFIFFANLTLLMHLAATLGIAITVVAKNFMLSFIFAPLIAVSLLLVGGFFIKSASVPKYLIWLTYSSPFRYAFEVFYINELSGRKLFCKASELIGNFCPITTGNQKIIMDIGTEASIWRGFVVLTGMVLILHSFSLGVLYLSTRKVKV